MSGRLEGKVAIVTGAGRGLGRGIAWKLAQEGAAVTIAEIDEETGQRTADEISGEGYPALFAHTDIANEEMVEQAVAKTVEAFGPVNVLVNNAGKNFYFEAHTMTEDEWDHAMDIDLKGPWLCSKHCIPHMMAQGGGSIINIASVHARLTTPGMFPYAAAKSGIVGLTRNMALDYGPHGIRVNAICPGWVRTRLVQQWLDKQPDPQDAEQSVLDVHPLGRIGTPEDIANFTAFIASDEASFITGAELYIDGGLSCQFAT